MGHKLGRSRTERSPPRRRPPRTGVVVAGPVLAADDAVAGVVRDAGDDDDAVGAALVGYAVAGGAGSGAGVAGRAGLLLVLLPPLVADHVLLVRVGGLAGQQPAGTAASSAGAPAETGAWSVWGYHWALAVSWPSSWACTCNLDGLLGGVGAASLPPRQTVASVRRSKISTPVRDVC